MSSDEEFYRALIRIKDELLAEKEAPFADIQYDTIFDDKVWASLPQKMSKRHSRATSKDITNYWLPLHTSRKEFSTTTTRPESPRASLTMGSDAKHTVNLNGDKKLEVRTRKQLEDLIAREKEARIRDKELRGKFAEIGKVLQGT